MKPIRYGPFRILENIGGNAFTLYFPSYMQIYVVNVENLWLYEPPLIEYQGENDQIASIGYFSLEYLDEIQQDTILDRRKRSSKQVSVDYLRVGLKGTNPSKAKWIEIGKVKELYPHFLENTTNLLGSKRLLVGRNDQVLKFLMKIQICQISVEHE